MVDVREEFVFACLNLALAQWRVSPCAVIDNRLVGVAVLPSALSRAWPLGHHPVVVHRDLGGGEVQGVPRYRQRGCQS
jgi:hypothetical protein